jgi:hypothetical protein
MTLRSVWAAVMFSVAACVQGGCATPSVWEAATRESRTIESIDGVVTTSAGGAGGRRIVVRYGGWGVSDVFYSIPLDASGSPPAHLLYAGKFRNVSAIGEDLAPGQGEAVGHHAFDAAAVADARTARAARGYVRSESPGITFAYLRRSDLVVAALRPDGTPVVIRGGSNDEVRFPEDSRIVLLPMEQARSAGERRAATAWAVALTPVTVAMDAALVAVAIPIRLIFGGC